MIVEERPMVSGLGVDLLRSEIQELRVHKPLGRRALREEKSHTVIFALNRSSFSLFGMTGIPCFTAHESATWA
jgi:hypothetical protein